MPEKLQPEYRFHFKIVDETTGEVIESDFTYFTSIDEYGDCESVNIHVGQMLRNFRKFSRAEYERENYAEPEPEDLDTEAA